MMVELVVQRRAQEEAPGSGVLYWAGWGLAHGHMVCLGGLWVTKHPGTLRGVEKLEFF